MVQMILNFKSIFKNILIGICIFAVLLILQNKVFDIVIISDTLCIVGAAYLIVGLFRFTRKLHFYDLLIYSSSKFFEVVFSKNYTKNNSKVGEYEDYKDKTVYNKQYKEFIAAGLLFLIISLILSLVQLINYFHQLNNLQK